MVSAWVQGNGVARHVKGHVTGCRDCTCLGSRAWFLRECRRTGWAPCKPNHDHNRGKLFHSGFEMILVPAPHSGAWVAPGTARQAGVQSTSQIKIVGAILKTLNRVVLRCGVMLCVVLPYVVLPCVVPHAWCYHAWCYEVWCYHA